jgi:hypothetical protein
MTINIPITIPDDLVEKLWLALSIDAGFSGSEDVSVVNFVDLWLRPKFLLALRELNTRNGIKSARTTAVTDTRDEISTITFKEL